MNDDIDDVIACHVILVKIVVQRKSNVGNGAMMGGALKGRICKRFEIKVCQSDMVVVEYVIVVVKVEGGVQCVGIYENPYADKKSQEKDLADLKGFFIFHNILG